MTAGALGRYRITAPLGAGAMGEVFLARDEWLGRDVAVKAMRPLPGYGDALSERFFNEAKAVAALAHPNVIQVFDLGEDDGVPFMVMEVAPGGSLKARLERGPRLGFEEIRALGIQMAHALAAAHERGILHRDVKPANILEARPGVWKLADFGVAHVPDARLTMTGQFLGSPAYAAPESLELGDFSPASDVYGLAATMFEVVTGRSPHLDRTHETRIVLGDLDTAAHAATIDPVVPASIRETILRGLARAPERRPPAAEVAALFAAVVELVAAPVAAPVADGTPRPRRTPAPVPSALVASPAVVAHDRERARQRRLRAGSLVLAAIAIALVTVAFASERGSDEAPLPAPAASPREATPTPTPTPTPAPARPRADDPDDREARWERVRTALASKRWKTADRELEQLVARYPDDEQAASLLDRLRAEVAQHERRKALATREHDIY